MARKPSTSATGYLPPAQDAVETCEAVQGCKGCDLWQRGAQAVFGEGRAGAGRCWSVNSPAIRKICTGRPFVGSAGLKRKLENGFLGVHRLQIEHMRPKPIQLDEQAPMPQIGCLAFVAMVI